MENIKTKIIPCENTARYHLYWVYFIAYGAMACFFPFFPHFMESRGLDYVQIGYCFSLTSIVSIIAQPLWGYISDKWYGKRKIIFALLILCGLSAFSFLFSFSFAAIAFSVILLIFFQGAAFPLADSYVYSISSDFPAVQYGRVRLFGSAGFGITAFVLGILLSYLNDSLMFIAYFGFMAVAAYFFLGAKFSEKPHGAAPHFREIGEILKNKKFLIFVLTVCVSSIATVSSGNYIAILVEKTGGNTASLGFLWLLVAFSELPLFYYGTFLLNKFGESRLYIAAMVLYAVRFFASSLCTNFIPVVIIQLLQAFTFPLFMLATTSKANRLLPDHMKATGMTLMTSLGYGLGGLIGNISGGYIIKHLDVFYLYKIYALICLLALGIKFFAKKRRPLNFFKGLFRLFCFKLLGRHSLFLPKSH